MNYVCLVCGGIINELINGQNFINQTKNNKTLFCPHCNVGLQLNYNLKYNIELEKYDVCWDFAIALRGD